MAGTTPRKNNGRYAVVRQAIEKFGGCREDVLRALFGGSCSREQAEQYALATAHCYGVSIAEFMRAYEHWKRAEQFTLPEPDDTLNPPHR